MNNVQAAQFVADAVRAAVDPPGREYELLYTADTAVDAADAAVEAVKARKTIRLRRWKVEILAGEGSIPPTSCIVIAVNELDARVIAFAMDGVFGRTEMEPGDIELVKIYTRILEVSDV